MITIIFIPLPRPKAYNKLKKKSFPFCLHQGRKQNAKLILFFDMCNKDLFFRSFGNGKPLVILHGILGSSDIWVPTARRLSANYRVIIPDLPNHGNSFHTNSLSYDAMALEVARFLHRNGIENPIMMGHSYGGKIVLTMAAKNYIDMEKIVLIDISSEQQKGENMQKLFEILQRPLPTFSTFSEAEKYFQNLVPSPSMAALLVKNLHRTGGVLQWRCNSQVLAFQYEEVMCSVGLPTASTVPLILLKGERSDYVTPTAVDMLRLSFQNFTLAEVPNAGHWVHADNFGGFVQALEQFLK